MTITEALLIAVVGAIASVVTSLIVAALQGYKWRTGEQPKSAADAAQSLTDTSLAIVTSMRADVEIMKKEISELREENEALKNQLDEMETVRDWAERLVHQVRSLGHEPVKMRVKVATK